MSDYEYANDQERLDHALKTLRASEKTAEMWRQQAGDYIRRWRVLEDEVVRLRETIRRLLVSHENMYKSVFGEQSDPDNDIVRREALAALPQTTPEGPRG